MKKVYVAASFSYQDSKKTNQRKKEIVDVVNKIKSVSNNQYLFLLPQNIEIENAWKMSLTEWSLKVYQKDIEELEEADLVIFISYGKENNSGSVWECGYAFKKGTPVIMIKMTDEVESLMLFGSAHAIIMYDEIDSYDWINLPKYKTPLNKLS